MNYVLINKADLKYVKSSVQNTMILSYSPLLCYCLFFPCVIASYIYIFFIIYLIISHLYITVGILAMKLYFVSLFYFFQYLILIGLANYRSRVEIYVL